MLSSQRLCPRSCRERVGCTNRLLIWLVTMSEVVARPKFRSGGTLKGPRHALDVARAGPPSRWLPRLGNAGGRLATRELQALGRSHRPRSCQAPWRNFAPSGCSHPGTAVELEAFTVWMRASRSG